LLQCIEALIQCLAMDVERWAKEHGLALTPENRPAVRRHLHHGRVCRTWGAVAGVVLPSLIDLVFYGRVTVLGFGTDGNSAPLGFGAIFVGYLAGAVVLAFSAGLEAVERWLVRRPQPFTSPSEIAADDAIRAQSIRDVAGAGLALLLLFCGGVALMLQASDITLARSVMIAPAVACVIGALLVYRGVGETAWRVRRSSGAAFP
jgi:hypothetical protein